MPADPHRFAEAWAAAWNNRDLDAVLSHFSDQVVFSTPKSLEAVGVPTVAGRNALRAYWEKALGRISQLHFSVVQVIWDPTERRLAIVYDREVNGARDRALELLTFSPSDQVVTGEVFYGVVPTL
jgi:limonene-1,2-epoxide hydrolase